MSGEVILLSHGGGGSRTSELLRDVIIPELANPVLTKLDDAACVSVPEQDVVFTTDSYVVQPLFFPGGDIGKLAVCGTVNDLAMQGAEPRYLTFGLILEEGLPIEDLRKIVRSAAKTAAEVGVLIVAGDTKVVERGKGSGVFINTAGIGVRRAGVDTSVGNARPGDAVIINGAIGDHGIAVMSVREGLTFATELVSDVAALSPMVSKLLDAVPGVRCLRDPTRGGLAAALNDIAQSSSVSIRLQESSIPVRKEVRGACGLLGFDPLNVANEGKALVVCAADEADRAVAALKSNAAGKDACIIGHVAESPEGRVLLETALGGERIVDVPLGEDLPRIC